MRKPAFVKPIRQKNFFAETAENEEIRKN